MIDDHDQHRDYQVASESIMHKTPSPASIGHENASMFVLVVMNMMMSMMMTSTMTMTATMTTVIVDANIDTDDGC